MVIELVFFTLLRDDVKSSVRSTAMGVGLLKMIEVDVDEHTTIIFQVTNDFNIQYKIDDVERRMDSFNKRKEKLEKIIPSITSDKKVSKFKEDVLDIDAKLENLKKDLEFYTILK